MPNKKYKLNDQQIFYREMVLGTLVYSVVLGFFNDYTKILETSSYSSTFLAAFVLQLLTYYTLFLKKWVGSKFTKHSKKSKFGFGFSVWLILFLSKFVFLATIDFIFGNNVNISGFFGLMFIVVVMTSLKESIDYFFKKLAD